jgi:hypothetical protein
MYSNCHIVKCHIEKSFNLTLGHRARTGAFHPAIRCPDNGAKSGSVPLTDGEGYLAWDRQRLSSRQTVFEVEPDRIPNIAHDLFVRPPPRVAAL